MHSEPPVAILQIRDMPDDLYLDLRDAAERSHRSIAQQAIVALRKAQALDVAARHGVIDRLLENAGAKARTKRVPAPEKLIRADRER
jgi:hypothetical protein